VYGKIIYLSFKSKHDPISISNSYFYSNSNILIKIIRGDNLDQISRFTQYMRHKSLFSMYHYYCRRCSRSCRDVIDAVSVKSNF